MYSASAAAELSKQSFDYPGAIRGYELFVPPGYDTENALSLLPALHGRGSSAGRMQQLTGFATRAAAHRFLVACADSPHRYWDYLHGIPGARRGRDDIDFLQRLAREKGSEFAAFASVAASGYGALPETCWARGPIDALSLHGTHDNLVPRQGQRVVGADGVIPPRIAGAVNLDYHAGDVIWSFFDRSRPRQ